MTETLAGKNWWIFSWLWHSSVQEELQMIRGIKPVSGFIAVETSDRRKSASQVTPTADDNCNQSRKEAGQGVRVNCANCPSINFYV